MLTKSTTFLLAGGLAGCALLLLRFTASQASPAPPQAEKVVVLKCERTLMLMRGARVLKTYRVSLGSHPVGAKTRQGDGKTPEGNYILDRRNPQISFHLSLFISYPDAADVARAQNWECHPEVTS